MPKKKVNKELFINKPAPDSLKNYPDQREANQKSQSNIVPVDFAVTEIDRVAKINSAV